MPTRKDDAYVQYLGTPIDALGNFVDRAEPSGAITMEGLQKTYLDLMNRPITPRYYVNWRCDKCRQAGFATDVDSVKNYHPTVCKRKAKADDIFVWPRGL